jgi:glycosyltransferase involved in cell wall biosynthesis
MENNSVATLQKSMSKRVLIVRSNPIAPDPRVEKEAHALVTAGYTVQVLGWDRSASQPLFEEKDGYLIHRIPIQSYYGMGIRNLPKLALWQIRLSSWLFTHRKEYDVLHACDFDTVLPCLMMKLLLGKKLVYDIFDFYTDHLRSTPTWIKQLIRAIDYRIINDADAVIIVDDTRRAQIKATSPKRLFIIYNSPKDVLKNIPTHQPSNQGQLRLAYVGLLQKERKLVEIAKLMQQHPEWTLDLAGFGGDEVLIHAVCQDIPNIRWHGRVDYDKALTLSAQADVLFAVYDPVIPNHKYSSPNKLFEAMMLAKPIIVARNTNMDEIIAKHACGFAVTYNNTNELEEAFTRLANDPALRERLGNNARLAYETTYTWEIMEQRLQALYSQVVSHG